MAKRKYNAYRFSVKGFGSFPMDMLRYDRAVPFDSNDALLLDGDNNSPVVVNLVAYVPMGNRLGPTIDRWRSFGWQVLPGTIEPIQD